MDITFWNELTVHISPNDWDFLCKNRFLSDNPSLDEIQAEFVSGTGISSNKKHLWSEADARFTEYVQELREIQGMNINQMARDLLKEGKDQIMSGNQDNKYTIIECSDDTEESLSFLLKKYVLDIPEEEVEVSKKRFKEIENGGVRLVKVVKNPFAKVHQAAVESGGNLSDETRKRMMKEAVHELRDNVQTAYDTERS